MSLSKWGQDGKIHPSTGNNEIAVPMKMEGQAKGLGRVFQRGNTNIGHISVQSPSPGREVFEHVLPACLRNLAKRHADGKVAIALGRQLYRRVHGPRFRVFTVDID